MSSRNEVSPPKVRKSKQGKGLQESSLIAAWNTGCKGLSEHHQENKD